MKRGVVNVARFARVLLARRGWLGAQPTREATGCHGWLAAPAPVGGSTSRARGLSSLAAAAVAVAGGSLA